MSTVILSSPSRYVQGPAALEALGEELTKLGTTPLFVADDTVWGIVKARLTSSVEAAGLTVSRVPFGTYATAQAVEDLAALIRTGNHDIVIGIGGGSCIDSAKAAGYLTGIRWASVPTAASSDAPTSALSVIYTDSGEFAEYRFFPHNPDLVLIDTTVVAHAPVRFLIAGIGDALATWLEARATRRGTALTMAGGRPTETGTHLAQLCWELLWDNALPAIDAVKGQVVTPALEAIVEANTLLSGLGFESGGLAAAHAIHNGLTAAESTHHLTHGEKVNIGSTAQLILEGAETDELEAFIVFTTRIGLPNTLTEIGLSPSDTEVLRAVAAAACAPGETIHAMPFPVTEEMVVAALIAMEEIATRVRADHGLPAPSLHPAIG